MMFRISVFIWLLFSGALLGIVLGGAWGAALGVGGAALAWFVLDMVRGLRVLAWLRQSDSEDQIEKTMPRLSGLWGDLVDRARRAMRRRDQQAQEARGQLQSFLSAIQASPNGVVLLDADNRISWCNQTAASHFGFDPQRDMQQQLGNLVRDPAFVAYCAQEDYSEEVVIPGRASTPSRPIKVSVRLHPYGQDLKLLLSRDITAVEQAEAMRRDFVANVSHEIRTPLTVLAGFVETLQNLPLAEAERARYLALMAQQADRMQALVSDLLMLSKLEGSPPPGSQEWTGLATLMSQCEQESRGLAQALGKSPQLQMAPAPALEISGVASEILSAMSNLVGNAVRYTPADGRIEAAWQVLPDGRLELSVKDTGVGIAPEHLPRLTERFYRVDRSRSRETGGTGLGLAIVKHVVQRHGGQLHIESTPGVGSTFTFQWPASRVRAAATPPKA